MAGCFKANIRPSAKAHGDFGKRSPPAADEHFQNPCNAGSRSEAPLLNSLLHMAESLDRIHARGLKGRLQAARHRDDDHNAHHGQKVCGV